MKSRHDPGVENEPHVRQNSFGTDPSEKTARTNQSKHPDNAVDHTVWDEPATNPILSGPVPKDAVTYRSWLEKHLAHRSWRRSWLYSLLLAVSAGPWAILGAMVFQYQSGFGGFVLATFIAPVTEELMKIAIIYWAAERRPFVFVSSTQIILCAIVSGFCFAVVENVFYLRFSLLDFTQWVTVWRWTVCVSLHVGCASIAGCGVAWMWRRAVRAVRRPNLGDAAPFIIIAVVIHGLYNATVTIIGFAESF